MKTLSNKELNFYLMNDPPINELYSEYFDLGNGVGLVTLVFESKGIAYKGNFVVCKTLEKTEVHPYLNRAPIEFKECQHVSKTTYEWEYL